MSTRAQICIKRDTIQFQETGGIYIYKHSDGYPKGVMPILKPFVQAFHESRGNDASYLLAQICRHFALEEAKNAPAEPSKYDEIYKYLGWGLDCVEHGDTEYFYEIDASTGEIYINGKLDK